MEFTPAPEPVQSEQYEAPAIVSREPVREPVISVAPGSTIRCVSPR